MSNILIISGSYFPYASANAICMKEFEQAMIARGDKVVYAIKKHDINTADITIEDNVKVYHIERSVDLFFSECEKLKKLDLPQPLKGLFCCCLLGIKVIGKIYAQLRYGSLRGLAEEKYLEKYADTIDKIVKEEKIDTIISISMPFLSHKAVLKYLKRNGKRKIKWISYMIDAYSQKFGVDGKVELIEELEVMKVSDRVIFLSVLKESYMKEPFLQYKDKFVFVPLPLLNLSDAPAVVKNICFNKNKVNFVYAGTLYDDTSALDYFVEFLKKNDSDKYVFHFIGKMYTRNLSLLEELKRECKAEIITYGFRTYDFAQEAIEQADILLNFGNLSPNQIPSKIYKYIVRKKPILTFYKIENDPSLSMLNKYPLALNIKEDIVVKEEDVKRFRDFIFISEKKKLTTEELRIIYEGETSEAISRLFIDNI